jgi:hypothetical protein
MIYTRTLKVHPKASNVFLHGAYTMKYSAANRQKCMDRSMHSLNPVPSLGLASRPCSRVFSARESKVSQMAQQSAWHS